MQARGGIFFVKKKIGADNVPWIRLMLDARQASRLHRRPPRVRLGSGRAMASLDLSDAALEWQTGVGGVTEVPVYGGSVDVDDAFYNARVPELAS